MPGKTITQVRSTSSLASLYYIVLSLGRSGLNITLLRP